MKPVRKTKSVSIKQIENMAYNLTQHLHVETRVGMSYMGFASGILVSDFYIVHRRTHTMNTWQALQQKYFELMGE